MTHVYLYDNGKVVELRGIHRDESAIVGPTGFPVVDLPKGNLLKRAEIERSVGYARNDARKSQNRANFLEVALRLFDDEVKADERKAEETRQAEFQRDLALSEHLMRAWNDVESVPMSNWPTRWGLIAKAAREFIADEEIEEIDGESDD